MPQFGIKIVANASQAKTEARSVEKILESIERQAYQTSLATASLNQNFKQVNSTVKQTERSANAFGAALKKAILPLTAALSIRQLALLSDEFTNIQNRLRTVTDSEADLVDVTNQLFEVANQTRSSFAGTAEVYARIGLSAKSLGRSQEELVQFTKRLNEAVILSGASATEAQAGLIQLSQGLASGALRGDELRSVLEQLPAVADVIAQHMKVTRGELRVLGSEGKISAQIVLDAFKEAGVELDEKFSKTVPTIGQSFQVLGNTFLRVVGQVNETTHAAQNFAEVILKISKLLEKLPEAVGRVSAVFKSLDAAIGELPSKLGRTGQNILGIITGVPIYAPDPAVKQSIGQIAKDLVATYDEAFRREMARQEWGIDAVVTQLGKMQKKVAETPIVLPPIEAITEPKLPPKLALQERIRAAGIEQDPLAQAVHNLSAATEDIQTIQGGVKDFANLEPAFKKTADSSLLLTTGIRSAQEALIDFVRTGKFGIGELAGAIRDATLRLLLNAGARSLGIPGFQHGGSFTVGGSGGPDSQLVAFKASPGENVTVTPPNVTSQVNLGIVNVHDRHQALSVLASRPGVQMIMNILEENRSTVRKLVTTT